MASAPEPKWRTGIYIVGAILGIILTVSAIVTNVFGILDRTRQTAGPAPIVQNNSQPAQNISQPAQGGSQTAADAEKEARQSALKEASAWIKAMNERDVDTLVSLSEPPFFLDQGNILLSKPDIRRQYEQLVASKPANAAPPPVNKMTVQTIAQLKAMGWNPKSDRFMSSMQLDDSDIAVVAFSGGEALIMFFRRTGPKVELAGTWD